MTAPLRPPRERPLVALIASVPLLAEALSSAIDFADVQTFEAGSGDVAGLLRWVRPDAVIVDTDTDATNAAAYALVEPLPVLHVSVENATLRLFKDGEWQHVAEQDASGPDTVRNVLAGALFARGGVAS